jgi:hypothetical protein
MSFLVRIQLPNTEITQTPTTSFSNLTAIALSAQFSTPSITGPLDPTAVLRWNIFNETLTGFDVFATVLSTQITTTQLVLSSRTETQSTSADVLLQVQAIDPTYQIFWDPTFVIFNFRLPVITLEYISAGQSGSASVNYDTTFFAKDVSIFEYYPINTTNPLEHTLQNVQTNTTITTGQEVFASDYSSVRVRFNTNYSNLLVIRTFAVSAVKIDNEPFVRSLTAQIIQNPNFIPIAPNQSILWRFSSPVWAQRKNRATYLSNTVAPLSDLDTMVFYVTAPTYNTSLQKYFLYTTNILLSGPTSLQAQAMQPGWTYDTFPQLNLDLFVNYENTNNTTYFYRLTSTSQYFANLSCRTSFTLNQAFNEATYLGWYTLNNGSQRITGLTPATAFTRTVPTVSSVQVFLSATTIPGTISPFFTPHIFTNTLSARFVSYFPQTDFIGFPDSYFNTATTVKYLNVSNYTESPGMLFYGEGHTGFIYLCAIPQNNVQYNWRLENSTKQFTFTAVNINNLTVTPNVTTLSSIAVRIPTVTNDNFEIPILLQVTDNNFSLNDPIYYYDDVDGRLLTYPYCATTQDANGNELTTTTRYRQSIKVLPYSLPRYAFTSGMKPVEILPTDGTRKSYQALFRLLEGPEPCYDKYGLIWKWSTFEGCSASPQTFTNKPSSWATMQCSGPRGRYPKKWRFEGPLSAAIFNVDPLSSFAGSITWLLSSSSGWPLIPLETTLTRYPFNIRANNFGTLRGTASIYAPTDIAVKVQQSISSHITASNVPANNQWIPKTSTITVISTSRFLTTPELRLYVPNKYILTGTNIAFENQITQQPVITSLEINFGNGVTKTYIGNEINSQFFTASGYNTLGFKNITVTANTSYLQIPRVTTTFNNIFYVKDRYDEIIPTEYQTDKEPLALPWPEPPVIGANDWVNEDNINSCFIKFYENIEYLKTRGQTYKTSYDEYYGYLAAPLASAENPAGCIAWTWEDLDPLNSILPTPVTWLDVFYTGNSATNGAQVNCGTWNQHIRNLNTQLPTCYGLYEVDWNWRSLKEANSQTLITWKNSKCDQEYNKRWYYEPGTLKSFIICDEGIWNVNLPNLDRYYPNIANKFIQQRCIYTGVVSRNNILYTAQKTQIKLLSSDYSASYFDTLFTVDKVREYSSIKNICLDTNNKIYVLDDIQAQVVAYTYDINATGDRWQTFATWGGFGGRGSKTKFYKPNDIHIDHLDNVLVADTGNNCVKHFSNTGTWVQTITDSVLLTATVLSVAVDSQKMVHILTNEEVRAYTYEGELAFTYSYKDYSSSAPKKINTSYNREILYIVFENEVQKFFRNGVFAGTIIQAQDSITNITGITQDEFRNLLITTNDKILKYVDTMTIQRYVGTLPTTYWPLSDLYIHQEEYIQNWVYTKSFQRMWDNIEAFKNILVYSTTDICKIYKPSPYGKEKMIIGQNEIVTSTVINRLLGYLWKNFYSIVEYFDPNCKS